MVLDTKRYLHDRQVIVTAGKKEQRPAWCPIWEDWYAALNGRLMEGEMCAGRDGNGRLCAWETSKVGTNSFLTWTRMDSRDFMKFRLDPAMSKTGLALSRIPEEYLCITFLAPGGRREAREQICLRVWLQGKSMWLMSQQLFGWANDSSWDIYGAQLFFKLVKM